MGSRVVTELYDDLNGEQSDDIETIRFGLDGAEYDIDLNGENAEEFREVLARYIEAGRRAGGRLKRRRFPVDGEVAAPTRTVVTGTTGRGKDALKAIRDWARKNGHEVNDRGRLPAKIVAEYDAAHAGKNSRAPQFTG